MQVCRTLNAWEAQVLRITPGPSPEVKAPQNARSFAEPASYELEKPAATEEQAEEDKEQVEERDGGEAAAGEQQAVKEEEQQAAVEEEQAAAEEEQAAVEEEQAAVEEGQAVVEEEQGPVEEEQAALEEEQAVMEEEQAAVEEEHESGSKWSATPSAPTAPQEPPAADKAAKSYTPAAAKMESEQPAELNTPTMAANAWAWAWPEEPSAVPEEAAAEPNAWAWAWPEQSAAAPEVAAAAPNAWAWPWAEQEAATTAEAEAPAAAEAWTEQPAVPHAPDVADAWAGTRPQQEETAPGAAKEAPAMSAPPGPITDAMLAEMAALAQQGQQYLFQAADPTAMQQVLAILLQQWQAEVQRVAWPGTEPADSITAEALTGFTRLPDTPAACQLLLDFWANPDGAMLALQGWHNVSECGLAVMGLIAMYAPLRSARMVAGGPLCPSAAFYLARMCATPPVWRGRGSAQDDAAANATAARTQDMARAVMPIALRLLMLRGPDASTAGFGLLAAPLGAAEAAAAKACAMVSATPALAATACTFLPPERDAGEFMELVFLSEGMDAPEVAELVSAAESGVSAVLAAPCCGPLPLGFLAVAARLSSLTARTAAWFIGLQQAQLAAAASEVDACRAREAQLLAQARKWRDAFAKEPRGQRGCETGQQGGFGGGGGCTALVVRSTQTAFAVEVEEEEQQQEEGEKKEACQELSSCGGATPQLLLLQGPSPPLADNKLLGSSPSRSGCGLIPSSLSFSRSGSSSGKDGAEAGAPYLKPAGSHATGPLVLLVRAAGSSDDDDNGYASSDGDTLLLQLSDSSFVSGGLRPVSGGGQAEGDDAGLVGGGGMFSAGAWGSTMPGSVVSLAAATTAAAHEWTSDPIGSEGASGLGSDAPQSGSWSAVFQGAVGSSGDEVASGKDAATDAEAAAEEATIWITETEAVETEDDVGTDELVEAVAAAFHKDLKQRLCTSLKHLAHGVAAGTRAVARCFGHSGRAGRGQRHGGRGRGSNVRYD
jgi:hypothetical protein